MGTYILMSFGNTTARRTKSFMLLISVTLFTDFMLFAYCNIIILHYYLFTYSRLEDSAFAAAGPRL